MRRTAHFLDPQTRRVRIHLGRYWDDDRPRAGWLLWNASRADEERDDRTISRVIGFSDHLGFGGAEIVNLWPLVTPKPRELWEMLKAGALTSADNARNLSCIEEVGRRVETRFVAFGAEAPNRSSAHIAEAVRRFGGDAELLCLGTSAHGWPLHPLARGRHRIPDNRQAEAWRYEMAG